MGIKHRADCAFRKFRILSKPSLSRQVSSSEMPYVSYPKPLGGMLRNTATIDR